MFNLTSLALFIFVLLLSLSLIGHALFSGFVTGVVGLIWCVLWLLAAAGVYDGNLRRSN